MRTTIYGNDDLQPESSSEKIYANVDSASMQGFECELSQDIAQDYNIRIGYHYLDTEDNSTVATGQRILSKFDFVQQCRRFFV